MPGSSLWLVPPPDSHLHQALQDLISTHIPSIFPHPPPPPLTPHLTLTSEVFSSHPHPQLWLDNLTLPPQEILAGLTISIRDVLIGSPLFRKLAMACSKNRELCGLVARCRVAGVEGVEEGEADEWVIARFGPHCSLMYSEVPVDEVEAKLHEVGEKVQYAKERYPDSKAASGGEIWLVPTYKAIEDWKPIAIRQLPEMKWEWLT
ncbi:hypothetical protein LTS02_001766 [Friedmanniomyces endolithicus]|nr:hypothetical protein LTS02_001766 [Friedmanniomyces endolithicus]